MFFRSGGPTKVNSNSWFYTKKQPFFSLNFTTVTCLASVWPLAHYHIITALDPEGLGNFITWHFVCVWMLVSMTSKWKWAAPSPKQHILPQHQSLLSVSYYVIISPFHLPKCSVWLAKYWFQKMRASSVTHSSRGSVYPGIDHQLVASL